MPRNEAQHAQDKMIRKFVTEDAVRRRVPLWIGLNSPSGGGKTKSGLRLAAGIKEVVGGDVHVIDTENDRALHYADGFEQTYGYRFKHTRFEPPFGSLDYLAAVQHCVALGAGVILIDSMSHEHDGIGGLLEQHESEIDRLQEEQRARNGGKYTSSRDELSGSAWKLPKMNRRKMINELMRLKVILIYGLRAKPKQDFDAKGKDRDKGYMPISGDDLLFEMTVSAFLPPLSEGTPDWAPKKRGERESVKKGPFKKLFERGRQLDEEIGREMAKWALGGAAPAQSAAAVKGTDVERAAVIRRFGPLREALSWDQATFTKWLEGTFGSPSRVSLSIQQLEDACLLLDVWASAGYEDYEAELAGLIELGRVKVVAP